MLPQPPHFYAGPGTIPWHEVVVQSLSRVQLFETLWTAAHQAYVSIADSWILLKLMCIESVMLTDHLILCHPLLLLPFDLSQHRGLFQ